MFTQTLTLTLVLASKMCVAPVLGGVNVIVSVFVVPASTLAWSDKSGVLIRGVPASLFIAYFRGS